MIECRGPSGWGTLYHSSLRMMSEDYWGRINCSLSRLSNSDLPSLFSRLGAGPLAFEIGLSILVYRSPRIEGPRLSPMVVTTFSQPSCSSAEERLLQVGACNNFSSFPFLLRAGNL